MLGALESSERPIDFVQPDVAAGDVEVVMPDAACWQFGWDDQSFGSADSFDAIAQFDRYAHAMQSDVAARPPQRVGINRLAPAERLLGQVKPGVRLIGVVGASRSYSSTKMQRPSQTYGRRIAALGGALNRCRSTVEEQHGIGVVVRRPEVAGGQVVRNGHEVRITGSLSGPRGAHLRMGDQFGIAKTISDGVDLFTCERVGRARTRAPVLHRLSVRKRRGVRRGDQRRAPQAVYLALPRS